VGRQVMASDEGADDASMAPMDEATVEPDREEGVGAASIRQLAEFYREGPADAAGLTGERANPPAGAFFV
jgi:hypothetical protein